MDHSQAIKALKQTGELLQQTNQQAQVIIILGGAVAAMTVANLPASRVTHDCDVLTSEPDDRYTKLRNRLLNNRACQRNG